MSEPDVIEGEVTEVAEEAPATTSALVKADPRPAAIGIFELGAMDEAEYQRQVQIIQQGQERVRALMRDLLVKGRDYMDFAKPGARDERVGLLKPGAEALATFFRLIPTFRHRTEVVTFEDERPDRIDVDVMAEAHYGSADGPVVGAGSGSATSWEVKYRYRRGQLECPNCHETGYLMKAKGTDRQGRPRTGWYCWSNPAKGKKGCGMEWARDDEPDIVSQEVGQVENPDPHELRNTLLKMATKRAWTDCVIRSLNASSLFTQDVEDMRSGSFGGDYGGDSDDDGMGSSASASTSAAGARNAARPTTALAKGEEWQDGEPGRFQAKLEKAPDGTRSTAAGLPVLEVEAKVGTSKHRVYLEGPMAQWAFLILGNAPKGTEIVVDATRFLFQWDDTGKPPAKRLRAVTRIGIRLPGGQWQTFPARGAAAPADDPKATSAPATTASSSAAEPMPDDDPGFPPSPGDPDDPGTTTTSPSDVNLVEAARREFEPQRANGEAGTKVDQQGSVYDVTWEQAPRTGMRFVLVRLLSDDDGLEYRFAYGGGLESQVLTQDGRGFRYHPGDQLRCTGTWTGSTLIIGRMAMRV